MLAVISVKFKREDRHKYLNCNVSSLVVANDKRRASNGDFYSCRAVG